MATKGNFHLGRKRCCTLARRPAEGILSPLLGSEQKGKFP